MTKGSEGEGDVQVCWCLGTRLQVRDLWKM